MDATVFWAILAAAALHAGWNAVVKVGLDRFSAILLLALVQSAIALLLLPLFAVPAAAAWPWLIASAGLHTGYKMFLIRAYEHGDLSQVYPLARGSAPLLVAVFGVVVLGEALGLTRALAVLAIGLGVTGMALERRSGVGGASAKAIAYALGTAGFTASYTLVDGVGARLSGSPSGFALWMFVGDGIGMVLVALALRGRAAFGGLAAEWKAGLAAGAMSLCSYWVAIWAFTVAPIALVAALRETSVLFAMVIAMVVLGEKIGAVRWIAAGLICVGVGLIWV